MVSWACSIPHPGWHDDRFSFFAGLTSDSCMAFQWGGRGPPPKKLSFLGDHGPTHMVPSANWSHHPKRTWVSSAIFVGSPMCTTHGTSMAIGFI